MKACIFFLAMYVCLHARVECSPQESIDKKALVAQLADLLTEKREYQERASLVPAGLPLSSGLMRVGDKHVEARGFSWVHVSPDQSHLERTARRLIFKGASANNEPSGEKVKGGYDVAWSQYYRLCRAYYNGGWQLGKYFQAGDGYVCHIGYGGKEKRIKTFYALINTCPDKTSAVWVPYPPTSSNSKTLPTGLLLAGYETYYSGWSKKTRYLYYCRAWYQRAYHPGKILVNRGSKGPYKCNFGWGGKEKVASKFQVLVDTCNNQNNGKK